MLNNKTFLNKKFTLEGKARAFVKLEKLDTLWFNTGTLCNLKCKGCYIESSPTNNSLKYIKFKNFKDYINEVLEYKMNTKTIGFTGGEPFMNPDIIDMLRLSLKSGFKVLVLSNGLRPIEINFKRLIKLPNLKNLTVRISIDHYEKCLHEKIRGNNTWNKLLNNIKWLYKNNFNITFASRLERNETEKEKRLGFDKLFKDLNLSIDANNKNFLVLFPPMNKNLPATEISQECWGVLKKDPNTIMCSSSRMIVHKKEDANTKVLACTLITKHKDFELGKELRNSKKFVYLNHPYCSQFCVLGNSSCS